jgi:hypothetical protein
LQITKIQFSIQNVYYVYYKMMGPWAKFLGGGGDGNHGIVHCSYIFVKGVRV